MTLNHSENLTSALHPRSKFLTFIAWVFIAITGFLVAMALTENIMFNFIFPFNEIKTIIKTAEAITYIPAGAKFYCSNIKLIFLGFFVVSAMALTSSIGLLKRKNWARILFIFIMTLEIIWYWGGVFLQGAVVPKILELPKLIGYSSSQNIEKTFFIIHTITTTVGIIFTILFGWIIKILISKNIKQEFLKT